VKQLDRNGLQGNRECLVEVLMLSRITQCCADGNQRLLVNEFMPLGSLEDHPHGLCSCPYYFPLLPELSFLMVA